MKLREILKDFDGIGKKEFYHQNTNTRVVLDGGLWIYQNGIGWFIDMNDWEKVGEPVTWQEAIEAWALNGETVICKLNNDTIRYKGMRSLGTSKDTMFWDQDESAFTANEIIKGKWYIEEELK